MQAFSTVYAVDISVDDDGDIVIRQDNPEKDQYVYVSLDRAAAFRRAFDSAVKQAKAEAQL